MSDVMILELSNDIWDPRFELPVFPKLNNPWIYGAYMHKLAGEDKKLGVKFTVHAMYCEKEPGYYTRWPDGSGGDTSHDELLGLAKVCESVVAQRILKRLRERDGKYNPNDKDTDTMWRFIFLEPFLKKRAGEVVGLTSQLKWSIHVVWSAVKYSGSSGPLKIWLMEEMKEYPLCHAVYNFWLGRMRKKGPFPRWALLEHFPGVPEIDFLAGLE